MASNGKGNAAVLERYSEVSNDAAEIIDLERPYTARVTIEGTAPALFHRWSCDVVKEKGEGGKGSLTKKTDDVQSYVWRDEDGYICLPGEYLRGSVINAARFRQDPRSPRKSAMDLFKAGIVSMTELASLGSKDWDYLDRRRAVVQRAGITRVRPAFKTGWQATIDLMVLIPAYIPPSLLRDVITDAGRLVGVGDMRPTFGRFAVVHWERVV